MLGARLGGCLRGVRAACLYHLSVDFNVAKTLGVDGEVGVKALVLRKAAAEVIPVVVRGQRCPVPVEPVSVAKPLVPLVVLALVHAALHPAELRHVVVAAVGRRIGASHPAGRLILALVQHHAAPAVLLTPVVAHALARVVVGHKLRPLDAHLVGHAQRGVLLALVDRHVAHKVANHHKVGVVARRGVAARHLVTLVGPALHVTEHPHVGVAAAPAMGAAKLDALVLLALVVVGVVALKGHHPALPARQHPALGVAAKVVAGIGRTLNPIPVHIMAPRDVEWIVVLAHAHSLWAVELVRNLVNGDKTNRQLPVLLKVVAQVHRVVALIIVAQLAGVPRLHGKVGVQALPVAADAIVLYALVHPAAHDSHLVGA
mmetsp:Transcript_6095/g.14695  ORF Transcript_6095/g.14695 Transcript_6095/m.14695 type:complete len:373 (-) Transcript_6095:2640-3758(-)